MAHHDHPSAPPAVIPGYDGGPYRHRPELLDDHLFWVGHLHNWCADLEEAEEFVDEAEDLAAGRLQAGLLSGEQWPVFTVPLGGGHLLHVVYRAFAGDEGIDYLLHHPEWEAAEPLAADEGCFSGPGLCWDELVAAADNGLPGGSTADPHARLLLLLPAFGEAEAPAGAADRLAAALRARTRFAEPERLAAALLAVQGPCGAPRWRRDPDGALVNDGEYSPRCATALPAARQARITAALAAR
ncbi:hypothetical protein Kpho02_01160 [Kitasatospora phosalacinea]|uniref:Uncharacterized protein n=1 Tax=Kitasatospora phosalacinea TaxID=2065 RepID=A0A9W6V026_9ACTN|nr:hypothetical protein [Kitasatospora phosalacinea]GLW67817.1 hypothetical protein Kpho02_01160 [Kitasatospora phosalacinea]